MHLESLTRIGTLKEANNCSLNLVYTEMYEMGLQWNDADGTSYLTVTSQSLIRLFMQCKINLLDIVAAPDSKFYQFENGEYLLITSKSKKRIPNLLESSTQFSNMEPASNAKLLDFINGDLRLRILKELVIQYNTGLLPCANVLTEPFVPIHKLKKAEIYKALHVSEEIKKLNNLLRLGITKVGFDIESLLIEILIDAEIKQDTYAELIVSILGLIIPMLSPQEDLFVPAIEKSAARWDLPFSAN